jgi:hypothetical protein
MAGEYAKGTTVTSAGSRAEIERTLERFGASAFGYATQNRQAVLMFEAHGRQIRYTLPLPDRNETRFTLTPARRNRRTPEDAAAAYEQAVRERWRALAAGVKAKLAMIEAGVTTFENEFLSQTVLPNGQTVAEATAPAIAAAYEGHDMPALLPGLGN